MAMTRADAIKKTIAWAKDCGIKQLDDKKGADKKK